VAWIESNQEVGRHPKTKKLARLLDVSVVSAVGHLHYLWWWALDFTQDGYIGKYDEFDIAEACMWEGEHQSFVNALIQAGFVDKTESGLLIHDWFDYAGRLIIQKDIKKEKNNERVKRFRDKSKKTCNADVMLCNAPTVPNLTVPNITVPNHTVPNHKEPKLNIIDDVIPRESELDSESTEPETQSQPVDLKLVAKRLPCNSRPIGTQAVDWAEKNWGRMIPKGDADSILAWCDEFSVSGSKDPDAVVIEGLKCCLDADVRNVKYLRAVLTDWRESGVLSVAQVKARQAEHLSQKKCKRNKDPGDKPQSAKTKSSKYEKFYL
jgi:DnaD/phage-associated family protein